MHSVSYGVGRVGIIKIIIQRINKILAIKFFHDNLMFYLIKAEI